MIEPTPNLFYTIITDSFGANSTFASRAVNSIQIVPDDHPSCQTLCIGKDGVIFVNGAFWKKNVRSYTDAKILFLHELFHAVTGDTAKLNSIPKGERFLANLSMDMRINAAICLCFLRHTGYGNNNILERLYRGGGIVGLLRPRSQYGINSKFKLIYAALYAQNMKQIGGGAEKKAKEIFASEEAIRSTLKILLKKTATTGEGIVFLGSHDGEESKGESESKEGEEGDKEAHEDIEIKELSDEVKEEIRTALGQQLSDTKKAGYSNTLIENMVLVIEQSRGLNMKALDRFDCNHKVNEIKAMFEKERKVTQIVPIRPSARDMSMVACGIIPTMWHNKQNFKAHQDKNIAIYLDVSGSVTGELPMLLGFIKNLDRKINTIYCFSTQVHEHTVQELSNGKYNTTGGTDFSCVAKHILENEKINKIVILTDGYADISKSYEEPLLKQLKDAAVIYFGSSVDKNNFFAKHYEKSFDIKELT